MPAPNDLGPAPARTLEDAVADMLKPMLQRWLSDNMPRIIERALSIEASRGGRDRG
jgi:cell pole-organizing protein PopZ